MNNKDYLKKNIFLALLVPIMIFLFMMRDYGVYFVLFIGNPFFLYSIIYFLVFVSLAVVIFRHVYVIFVNLRQEQVPDKAEVREEPVPDKVEVGEEPVPDKGEQVQERSNPTPTDIHRSEVLSEAALYNAGIEVSNKEVIIQAKEMAAEDFHENEMLVDDYV